MLAQDYLKLVATDDPGSCRDSDAERSRLRWRQLCAGLDPLAPADEAGYDTPPPDGPSPRL